MISINKLQINQLVTQIDVDITTSDGGIFTKIEAWPAEDFKVQDKAIDLTSL